MQRCATLLLTALCLGFTASAQSPIKIVADLSEAPRKIYHADVDLPVKSGPLTLTTPEWIPGNHRPTGPVDDITGVVFTANGQTLKWRRDNVDLYAFHLVVPEGVTTLHAHLDCIVTARVTPTMAVLEWEKLLLYPANTPVKNIAIQPSVKVPEGWGIGTALAPLQPYDPQHPAGNRVDYAATTVEQLEDSPVISGRYFHEFVLAPEITPSHYLDVVSDLPQDSQLRPVVITEVSNLVREATALYGSHHYNVYHFLLTLSDVAGGEGLEHGQSSDNGIDENGFADDTHQLGESDLLAHEFTHSWNGKYRRPARLYQPTFSTPEQTDLLWVYEGLTQYLGNVLAARSGLKSQEQYRDLLALSAANLDYKPGRQWRSTEDTAIASSVLRGGSPIWSNWKRGQDYYQEGELFWLDVDTLIRKQSNDKKSLADFLHIFLSKGGNTGPLILPYERSEIIADLNQVLPYDWAGFIERRIDDLNPHADLDGIEHGGYRLIYSDKPSAGENTLNAAASRRGTGIDVWYSLGFRVNPAGFLTDVRWNGPADKALLGPGQKIVAVNGHVFSADALRTAIDDATRNTEPLHFILQAEGLVTSADINYHDGQRYPRLERVENQPDYLDEITRPITKPPADKKP